MLLLARKIDWIRALFRGLRQELALFYVWKEGKGVE